MKRFMNGWKQVMAVCLVLFVAAASLFFPCNSYAAQNQTAASEPLSPDMDTVLVSVRDYILKTDTNPDFDSVWNVIGLVRSGVSVPESYLNTFYKNTLHELEEKNWVLSKIKYTEYSKLIVGLTAIGKDARDINGHNLLSYLSDFANVKYQGFNGPVWALIALKSNPAYSIPKDAAAREQTTEEGLIQCILGYEISSGGWSLDRKRADSDMTAMTIQALAPYYGKRADVTNAVNRALDWLSGSQFSSGGFGTSNGGSLLETSESASQVIVALSALGIDSAKDSRFIKNGKWPMTGLFQYYLPEGGFTHILADTGNNGGGAGGVINDMATSQGLYAIAAYKRLLEGKTALYDMSEMKFASENEEEQEQENDSTASDHTSPDDAATGSTASDSTTAAGNETIHVNTQKLKLKIDKITTSSITLKWNKVAGAKLYKIYRYDTKKKRYKEITRLSAKKNSYVLKRQNGSKGDRLTPGTAYQLKLVVYQTVNGTNKGTKSAVVRTATRPSKTKLIRLTRKSSRRIKLTWKRVKPGSGYEIYMSTRKKAGYKKIKTITKGSTVSYTKIKLKKGKTYYFKIRAYKKVGSKKIYGSFSTVKQMKVR